MKKRLMKKKYKKMCDKYNIPYSSYEANRKNKTMHKSEYKRIRTILHNVIVITRMSNSIKHTMIPIDAPTNFNSYTNYLQRVANNISRLGNMIQKL